MPQYSSATSLQKTGRTLARVVLTESELEYLLLKTANSKGLGIDIHEKLAKVKRYEERVVRRSN